MVLAVVKSVEQLCLEMIQKTILSVHTLRMKLGLT